MKSLVIFVLVLLTSSSLAFTPPFLAYLGGGGSAVDVKGKHYNGSDYPGQLPPWMLDRIISVAPFCPENDRMLAHSGSGRFRLLLDPKTGTVTQVIVQQSTGFISLDNAAIAAFRLWRWKPGRWRQIDTGCSFSPHSRMPRHLPPDIVRLPLY
jgi:TonB family protein